MKTLPIFGGKVLSMQIVFLCFLHAYQNEKNETAWQICLVLQKLTKLCVSSQFETCILQ